MSRGNADSCLLPRERTRIGFVGRGRNVPDWVVATGRDGQGGWKALFGEWFERSQSTSRACASLTTTIMLHYKSQPAHPPNHLFHPPSSLPSRLQGQALVLSFPFQFLLSGYSTGRSQLSSCSSLFPSPPCSPASLSSSLPLTVASRPPPRNVHGRSRSP